MSILMSKSCLVLVAQTLPYYYFTGVFLSPSLDVSRF
jgi:hypothetical protein